ncbi:AAA family ATPase [Sphaerisporangium sp. TRM90804]|uniref:helix-turn-helix transcriptional regulator n=1 Tax=Sphaerisporangium sp. TRM90804 TaxID=3031113 RepID=UPI00244B2833|nr:AAA family ATPase [Sphaerisporangium sp. TRM90804]MDH2429921.1 AAA family ATPase [Sphaerisporangium sp. TRM90804]
MRGRETEWQIVDRLLKAASHGESGTLLVEGEPGAGKTLLLAEAAAHASDRGFLPAAGRAEEMTPLVPLAPLFTALRMPAPGEALPGAPDPRLRLVERLREALVSRAAARPVLVALDDLQWADPPTLAALRALQDEPAAVPVVWVLARCTFAAGPHHPPASPGAGDAAGEAARRLFRVLERRGARRVGLGPLREGAVADLVADLLGAVPEPALLELAACAGGNPLLITELVTGLREEGAVGARDGGARPPPERVHAAVRCRMAGLRPQTRHLVEAAAVLGRSFSPEDVAELVGATPAALLPAFEEALESGILAAGEDALEFRCELVWLAVAAALPAAVRHALHHQVGRALLERGGCPSRAASHLIEGARPGDGRTLTSLDRAVAEIVTTSPPAAADLAAQAVLLSDDADPGRLARVVTAAEALTQAGRLAEAGDLVRSALTRPAPGPAAAALRCALSGILLLSGRPAEAVAEAEAALSGIPLLSGRSAEEVSVEEVTEAETALSTSRPGPDGDLRDRATLALLYGLAVSDVERAGREAEAVLSGGRHGDAAVTGAMVVLATARWWSGRLAEGLGLAREAVRRTRGAPAAVRRAHPRLALASMLADARLLDEAWTVAGQAREEIEALDHRVWAALPALIRARVALAAGRADDAVAEARAGLDLAESHGAHLFTPLAQPVLATAALRRGDLRAAARHLDAAQAAGHGIPTTRPHSSPAAGPGPAAPPPEPDTLDAATAHARDTPPARPRDVGPPMGDRLVMVRARIGEARDGPGAALEEVAALCAALRERPGALSGDPADAAWLVRAALAAGDRAAAGWAAGAARTLASANPGFAAARAAAVHARGLLDGDTAALAQAAGQGPDPWARASAAEDLGVALTARGDRPGAVRALDLALTEYGESGSTPDAARVRRRLRRMGVRHRHWATAERPVSGWESLTDTEAAVCLLVTQGWTNRQVADQMFISAHTVAFHLRQVFRKLGIGSRVELTRLAVERGHPLAAPPDGPRTAGRARHDDPRPPAGRPGAA